MGLFSNTCFCEPRDVQENSPKEDTARNNNGASKGAEQYDHKTVDDQGKEEGLERTRVRVLDEFGHLKVRNEFKHQIG